jgi:hypothetical protein
VAGRAVLCPPRELVPWAQAPLGLVARGAGVAAAGFGLRLMLLADLMKQNQLYCYTNRAEQNVHYARKDLFL